MVDLSKILDEYIDALEKAEEKDAYKVYEKYAERLQFDIKHADSDSYWKVHGETITYFGKIEFFESKDTLSRKFGYSGRTQVFGHVIDKEERELLISKYPEKCPECGFHRFFGVRIEYFGIGSIIEYFCPSCEKKLADVIGSEEW